MLNKDDTGKDISPTRWAKGKREPNLSDLRIRPEAVYIGWAVVNRTFSNKRIFSAHFDRSHADSYASKFKGSTVIRIVAVETTLPCQTVGGKWVFADGHEYHEQRG